MLAIGLPTGYEFAITTVYLALVYAIARPFGAAAQAGFGIGMRIVQALFLPVVALGFSVAPVAGQNFGARQAQRVRLTFRDAALLALSVMVPFAIVCHLAAAPLTGFFTRDSTVITYGSEYLRIIAFSFIASGLVFVTSSMFQAMGNTVPSMVASTVRIGLVAVPAVIVARRPGFELTWLWYLSLGSMYAQLAIGLGLLRREFARRLAWAPA
jgi:Na+-driven multidrug efflux pump